MTTEPDELPGSFHVARLPLTAKPGSFHDERDRRMEAPEG